MIGFSDHTRAETRRTEIRHFSYEYNFLSNFFPCPIAGPSGLIYPSVEHAYQAAKSLDPAVHERFQQTPSAGLVKRLGRSITIRPNWEQLKLPNMRRFLEQKFHRTTALSLRLEKTGKRPLIEGNTWHDNFWGACSCENCRHRAQFNHLGRQLMEIRALLIG